MIRQEKIKEIRSLSVRYNNAELAKKFEIPVERISRIINEREDRNLCDKHWKFFTNKCFRCFESNIPEWVKIVIAPDRSQAKFKERMKVVKKLRDIGFSYLQIGKLIKRDHSTIIKNLRNEVFRRNKE